MCRQIALANANGRPAYPSCVNCKTAKTPQQCGGHLLNKKIIHHLFCRSCGVEPFARGKKPDGSAAIAVNARCLEGVDFAALKPMPFDGRNV